MPNANCTVNVGEPSIVNIKFCNIIAMVVRLAVPKWEQLKFPDGNLYLFTYTNSVHLASR